MRKENTPRDSNNRRKLVYGIGAAVCILMVGTATGITIYHSKTSSEMDSPRISSDLPKTAGVTLATKEKVSPRKDGEESSKQNNKKAHTLEIEADREDSPTTKPDQPLYKEMDTQSVADTLKEPVKGTEIVEQTTSPVKQNSSISTSETTTPPSSNKTTPAKQEKGEEMTPKDPKPDEEEKNSDSGSKTPEEIHEKEKDSSTKDSKYVSAAEANKILSDCGLFRKNKDEYFLEDEWGHVLNVKVGSAHVGFIYFDGTTYYTAKETSYEDVLELMEGDEEKAELQWQYIQSMIMENEMAVRAAANALFGEGTDKAKGLYNEILQAGHSANGYFKEFS